MKKKILVYMETDTDWGNKFVEEDIKQELNCCSCFYENIIVNIWNIEDDENENKTSE